MKTEKAKQFSRMIWRKRTREAAIFFVIPVLILGIYIIFLADEQGAERTQVMGTVQSWSAAQNETGTAGYIIWVVLEDDSRVAATADRHGRTPINGESIEVTRVETQSGRLRYHWSRKPAKTIPAKRTP